MKGRNSLADPPLAVCTEACEGDAAVLTQNLNFMCVNVNGLSRKKYAQVFQTLRAREIDVALLVEHKKRLKKGDLPQPDGA